MSIPNLSDSTLSQEGEHSPAAEVVSQSRVRLGSLSRFDALALALITVVIGGAMGVLLTQLVKIFSDYGAHLEFVQTLRTGQDFFTFIQTVPHFLFHILVILLAPFVPNGDLQIAALVIMLGFYLATAWICYGLLRAFLAVPQSWGQAGTYALLTIVFIFAAPINFFTAENYLGYIHINAYHNPTIVILKPFALLLFWIAYKSLDLKNKPQTRQLTLLVFVLSIFAVLAKPSFTVALLPALVLFVYYRWRGEYFVNWWVIVVGIIVPSVVLLALQVVVSRESTGFMFWPFLTLRLWTPDLGALFFKLLISYLFPAVVYLLYFRQAKLRLYLNFAWVTAGVGAAYAVLLSEATRPAYGNWIWSAQITLFILFIFSTIFLMQRYQAEAAARGSAVPSRKVMFALGILGLHVISGIGYYSFFLSGNVL